MRGEAKTAERDKGLRSEDDSRRGRQRTMAGGGWCVSGVRRKQPSMFLTERKARRWFPAVLLLVGLLTGLILGPGGKTASVALVLSENSAEAEAFVASFKGLLPGGCEEYNLQGSDLKQKEIGERLKSSPPAVTVVVGDLAGQMAKWNLEASPVVYAAVPAAAKIALTTMKSAGIYHEPDPAEGMAFIPKLFPGRTRVTLLYSPQYSPVKPERLSSAASSLGLTLNPAAVESVKALPDQLKQILPDSDLLWLFTDPVVFSPHSIQYVVLQSLTAKVPIFCGSAELARSGATAALVPEPADVAAKAAQAAKDILNGKNPSAGTVLYPQGRLILNQKAAGLLGLSFPPDLLSSAEVIE